METIWWLTYSLSVVEIMEYDFLSLFFHMAQSLFDAGMVGLLLICYAFDSTSSSLETIAS
jgi:hypothetical protein